MRSNFLRWVKEDVARSVADLERRREVYAGLGLTLAEPVERMNNVAVGVAVHKLLEQQLLLEKK